MKKEVIVFNSGERALTLPGDPAQAIRDKYAKKRKPSHRILPGFQPPMQAAAIDEREKTIIVADALGVIRILDNPTGRCRMVIQPNADPVVAAGISLSGEEACLKTAGGKMIAWNLKTGLWSESAPVFPIRFTGNDPERLQTQFSKPVKRLISERNLWPIAGVMAEAGKTLVTADIEAVRKWDMNTGRYAVIEGHAGAISTAAITPDSKTLLTGSWDHTARVWNLVKHVSVELSGHDDGVTASAVSTFGSIAATGSHDKTVRLWDLRTARAAQILNHDTAVTAVALSPPKEGLVASGAADGSCRIWNISGSLQRDLKGHFGPVNCMAFFPDSPILLTGSEDGSVWIWNLSSPDTPVILEGHNHPVTALYVINTHPFQVITGDAGGKVLIHELTRENKAIQGGQPLQGHDSAITFIAVTAEGETIITGSLDRTILFHRREKRQLLGKVHYLSKGFLWTTPPDDRTPNGYLLTDRKELVSVFEVNEIDGAHPCPLWDDESIKNYITGVDNAEMLLLRINDYEKYIKHPKPPRPMPYLPYSYKKGYELPERSSGG